MHAHPPDVCAAFVYVVRVWVGAGRHILVLSICSVSISCAHACSEPLTCPGCGLRVRRCRFLYHELLGWGHADDAFVMQTHKDGSPPESVVERFFLTKQVRWRVQQRCELCVTQPCWPQGFEIDTLGAAYASTGS